MKYLFFLFFIYVFPFQKITAQDSIRSISFKFSERFGKYKCNNKWVSEDKMQSVFKETKDENLIRLVRNSNISSWNKHIGYAAIPAGVGCVVSFLVFKANLDSYNNSPNQTITHQLSEKEYNQWLTVIGIFASATISFPVMSKIADISRGKYNRQAIKLYNEKY
jgi:hypothetical protein